MSFQDTTVVTDSLQAADSLAAAGESAVGNGAPPDLLISLVWLAVATLALVATLIAIRRVIPWIGTRVEALQRVAVIPSLKIQNLEIISARRLAEVTKVLLSVAQVALSIAALVVYVAVVLGLFPGTRPLVTQVLGYALDPLADMWRGFVGYVPDLIAIGVILLVIRYVLKLVRMIFLGIASGAVRFSGFYREWAMPTYKIVRFLVLVFGLVMIFPLLPGSDTMAFRGVSVFVGVLLSFGSSSAIANVVGGVVLTYMRPFRIGDRVKIADTTGDVVEKSLLVTRIRTPKRVDITIPNSLVLGAHMVNYSATDDDPHLILPTTVTLGYDVEWRRVHELLLEAAATTDRVLTEPAPFVLQTALNDFHVSYELNVWTDHPNHMVEIYSALHANILDVFNKANVEILSPAFSALRDGNSSTVPGRSLLEKRGVPEP